MECTFQSFNFRGVKFLTPTKKSRNEKPEWFYYSETLPHSKSFGFRSREFDLRKIDFFGVVRPFFPCGPFLGPGSPFPLHIWPHLMGPTPTPGPKFSPRRKSRGAKSPSGFITPKPRPIPNLLVLGHGNSICEKSIFWCQVVRPLFFESLPCLKIPAREPVPTAHLASFNGSFD